MNMQVKHYILTNDGRIAEFSTEEAFKVANRLSALPEYASSRQRYVQVQFDEPEEATEDSLKVRIAGAYVSFDGQGRLSDANAPAENESAITRFEHETCVQLALRAALGERVTVH
jgi:RNase P/RNase MRP subunit POP5